MSNTLNPPMPPLNPPFPYELSESDEALDEAALIERLRQQFSSSSYTPPRLPSVAFDVLALSRRPNVSIAELVALLERDSFLASRVVALARSPLYGGTMPVVALYPAVVRLGLSQVRQLVLEAAINLKVFTAQRHAATMHSVRKHSTTVAYLARMVARFTAIDAETAFLTGLVHDIGIAAALLLMGEGPEKNHVALTPYVWSAIDRIHAEISHLLVSLWGLSPALELSVGQHHGVGSGPVHPLASVIMLAEALAHELTGGIVPSLKTEADEVVWSSVEATAPGQLEQATTLLRIDERQLALIYKEAKTLVGKLNDHG